LEDYVKRLKEYFPVIRRAFSLIGGLVLANAAVFAGSTGRLAITQGISALSQEISGPLAYGVALGGVSLAGFDAYRHRGQELGAIGWTGVGIVGAAGISMGAPALLSLIPGAAGLIV
jgi:hypothetical protein